MHLFDILPTISSGKVGNFFLSEECLGLGLVINRQLINVTFLPTWEKCCNKYSSHRMASDTVLK